MFKDQASAVTTTKPEYTCVFNTTELFIRRLMDVVDRGPDSIESNEELTKKLNGKTYRIEKKIKATLEEMGE